MRAVHAYEGFDAIHDHMPGADGALRVTGTVVFVQGGWTAELMPLGEPSGISQLMLTLDLALTGPPPGSGVPEVLTPVPVECTIERPEIEYREVAFRLSSDTEDDPPQTIDVVHPE